MLATLVLVYRPVVLHALLTPTGSEDAGFLRAFTATTGTAAVVVGLPGGIQLPIGGRWTAAPGAAAARWRLCWLRRSTKAEVVHVIGSPALAEASRWAEAMSLPLAVTVPADWQPTEADIGALHRAALVIAQPGDPVAGQLDPARVRYVDLSVEAVEDAVGARAADLDEQWASLAKSGVPAPQRTPPSELPTISVVMVTFNRRSLLEEALEALAAQDYPRDLIDICIVDNASNDGSAELLTEWTGRLPLTVIRVDEHIPVAEARNRAVARTTGEIVAFTDDDCRATPKWLRALAQGFSTGIGMVQGQTAADQRQVALALSRTQQTPAEAGLYETCNIAYRRDVLPGVGVDGPFDLHFAEVVERTLGKRLGRYPFGEDTEMAWRVKSTGVSSRFAQDALIFHHVFPPDVSYLLRRSVLVAAFPVLLARIPTLRRSLLTGGFLLGKRRAKWWLGILGASLCWISPLTLLAFLPYLEAVLKPRRKRKLDRLKALPVLMSRDLLESLALVYGSVRARCLVL